MTDEPTQPETVPAGFNEALRRRVLALAAEAISVEELAKQLGITETDSFEHWLEDLARQGFLQRVKRNATSGPTAKSPPACFGAAKTALLSNPMTRTSA